MEKIKIRPHTNDWLTKGIVTSTKEKNRLYKNINVIRQLKMNIFRKDFKTN